MLDPTKFDPRRIDRGAGLEAKEHYLSALDSALFHGLRAAQAVADGGPADADLLDEYAEALEGLRVGIAANLLSCNGWLVPTEDDVRNARHLVQLVRDGASSEALVEPARRASRMRILDKRGSTDES